MDEYAKVKNKKILTNNDKAEEDTVTFVLHDMRNP